VKRIGVFLCHCGLNIADTVDIERVAEEIGEYPGVTYAVDYRYMCSDPGQQIIKDAIRDHGLEGVVVAACSPYMHEATFRKTAASAQLNPYQCEIANIREQCSWVHQEAKVEATAKAVVIVRTVVEKVRYNESLAPLALPLTKRAMVIGGGVAGLQAALDIADAGHPVILVEKEANLGGHAARLSGTYLGLDTFPEMLNSMIRRVQEHPYIQVQTQAEVQQAAGFVGNFTVEVQQHDSSVAEHRRSDPVTYTLDVGAIVVATGYELYAKEKLGEYGGGRYPNVVQCAGSRDPQFHKPYCSKICCMYVAKQAISYKKRVPQGQAYVFYIDIRSAGKNHEEFVQRAMEEYNVLYLRGKVSKVFEEDGKVMVWGVDTLTGVPVEVAADLVVLASAAVPSTHARELAQRLRIPVDEHGFFTEAHPKLRPVESLTPGVFLAGAGQFPKDIPETISQASAAAAKVLQLFSQREMVQEPVIARVDEELCSGCGLCVAACPYEALAMHRRLPIAVVNQALCQGCSACVAVCPDKACSVHNYDTAQMLAMLEALL